MPAARRPSRPESPLGWGGVAVGFAAVVYGLSTATGVRTPYVLAGFVVAAWIVTVWWCYGLSLAGRDDRTRTAATDPRETTPRREQESDAPSALAETDRPEPIPESATAGEDEGATRGEGETARAAASGGERSKETGSARENGAPRDDR